MAQVPLTIVIDFFNDQVSLNDNICELRNPPMTRGTMEYKNSTYMPVEDTIFFRVVGSGGNYQNAQTRINDIMRYAHHEHANNGSFERPRLYITSSGSESYWTHMSDMKLTLPDESFNVALLNGVGDISLSFTHGSWKSTTRSTSTTASGSIPCVFTMSGLAPTNYHSSCSLNIHPFAHSMQRTIPSGILVFTNDLVGLKIIDLDTTVATYPQFTEVSNNTAQGAKHLRFTHGIAGSKATYSGELSVTVPFISNMIFPYASVSDYRSHRKVAMFAAVRCSGSYQVVAGLTEDRQSMYTGEPVYLSNYHNPHVVYLGTITSQKLVRGAPYFQVTGLTTSGYFDIDYIAYAGLDNPYAQIVYIGETTLSGIGGGSLTFYNPANTAPSDFQTVKSVGDNAIALFNESCYSVSQSLTTVLNKTRNVPFMGDIALKWESHGRYGNAVPFTTWGNPNAAYAMVLATGSGGAWSYRTISGVAPVHYATLAVTAESPYFPRL